MRFDEITNKWQAVLAFIVFIVGAFITIDTRYAKSDVVASVQTDLDTYKLEVERDKVQQRIWDTQDRLEQKQKSPEVKVELEKRIRELQDSLIKADDKLKDLKK